MAGRIPETFINDLLARVDIVDVVDERVPLKKTGKNYSARCPFHEERSPSFTVAPDKQFYYCFGCGASGSAIGFLMEYEHIDFVEAVQELAGRVGMTVPTDGGAPPARTGDGARLYGLLEQAQQFYSKQLKEHPQSERAKAYLKGRGLDGQTAASFRLGYAPPGWDNLLKALGTTPELVRDLEATGMLVQKDGAGSSAGTQGRHYDRFRDRIMFPIHDHRGRIIGFGGRILDQGEPKYLNSPETPIFHKGRELYGLYHARKANRELQRLFVVEGYMDVIALHQHGVTNAVATLGTATTRDHLERLFRVTPEVTFCFDGDNAGKNAALRALETSLPVLGGGHYVSFLFLPEGEDPDTLVRKHGPEFFHDRKHLKSLSDFLCESIESQVSLSSVDGSARIQELAIPKLALVPNGPYKVELARAFSNRFRLDLARIAPKLGIDVTESDTKGLENPAGRSQGMRKEVSLVRHAITLLLQRPQMATLVYQARDLARAGQSGAELLAELVEFIQTSPGIGAGALLEHWRERPEARHLHKLLAADIATPPDGMEAEFLGAIERLRVHADKTIRADLARKQLKDMTEEEKALLRKGRLSDS